MDFQSSLNSMKPYEDKQFLLDTKWRKSNSLFDTNKPGALDKSISSPKTNSTEK